LSSPWAEQREKKTAYANAQLLDLVTCKEVIVSQATENEERIRLQQALDADRHDIRRICLALFCSEFILVSVFTLIAPLLFIFVFIHTPTMERLFQILIIIVVLDEMTKAFLLYIGNGPIHEEYKRAKAKFCTVLALPEHILFPPEFPWLYHQPQDTTHHHSPKDIESTSEEYMEEGKIQISNEVDVLDEQLSKFVEMSLRSLEPKGSISLEGISFGYTTVDGSTFHVVDNLDLSFALGGRYAIMGETGAGKSTIFKVNIFRFFVNLCRSWNFRSNFL